MSEPATTTHRLREVLLSTGAVLGLVSLLIAATAAVFDITPLVFRSGSMSPAVEAGDLGIARTVPADDLRRGDIVSVFTADGERVTHRVVGLDRTGTTTLLSLQGDGNEEPDSEQYDVTSAERLLFSIPRMGYVASWLAGPGGLFLGALLVGAVLLVLLRRPTGTPPSGRRRADPTARTGALVLAAALLGVPLFAHPTEPQGTLAAWNDPVDVTGANTTGYTVPAPGGGGCAPISTGTSSSRGVRLTWPATAASLPALSYTTPTYNNITPLTNTVTTVGSDKVLTQTYNPSLTANQNDIVTVTDRAFPTGAATWLSPVTTWKYRTGATSSTQPVCGEITPPELEFVAPDATTRSVTSERNFITSACTTNTVIFCGTYADANAVTVSYTLRRVVSGVTRCWTGSWTSTAVGGACTAFQPADTASVGGTNTWYDQGTQSTVYASPGGAGTYTLTVQGTDTWFNLTTETLTFTLT